MDIHKNARLTLYGREALAKMGGTTHGVTLKSAAADFKVSARTAAVRRYQDNGRAGLHDRSSPPADFIDQRRRT